ncbi:MAG: hypothetical protein ACM3VS_04540 [Candidatus Dadabacteria bacterium]
MKCLKRYAVIACFLCTAMHSIAQGPNKIINEPDYNKAKIFNDLPDRMNIRLVDVDALVNLPVGSPVNTVVAPNFRAIGTVVSSSEDKLEDMKSVVIKLQNRQGAIFTFTKRKLEQDTYSYSGRILNKNNGDAFDLVKENGQYVLLKKGINELISE